ncbi:MAG: AMP-binding protein [Actinobacteria bacterium]|nr:AMP-binding protein [Actinomycetota bacterium]
MADLVALDLPAGPEFVGALRRAWDRGDAVLPVDQRLAPPARLALVERMRPARVVEPGGDPSGRSLAEAVPVLDGDALVVPTSGTTGAPKGVVHTHASVAAHARAVHERLAVERASDRWLSCLPLAHVGGLGVVTRALVTGLRVEVHEHFDVEAVLDAARRGATLVSLVPTALDRLPEVPFRWVVLGGSADPVARPANVVRTYGSTESGGGVVYDGVPLAGVEVRVDDDGAIALRGPTLLRAYRLDPSQEGPAGTDPKATDGWFTTGDIGAWDEVSARLTVAGRRGDLIVTGGENVWPGPVEAVIATHPAVAAVAVVGRRDPDWGERVVAVVVPRTGVARPSLDALRDHVKATLPPWCAPRSLELVDALPRTALGKVRRDAVAADDQADGQRRAEQ